MSMAKQHSGAQVNGLNHSANKIRVLIADDHPAVRRGVAIAMEAEPDMVVVGEAKDGAEAIAQCRLLAPHAILIDLQMPRVDGLEAIATIHAELPDAIIVVLTTYAGDARVMRALTMGATSYLLKSAELSDIIQAIRSAVGGKHTVDADVARDLARHAGSENLTPRELSVLRLAAKGRGNRAIAEVLGISEDTVKSRMRSIMGKLGADDRTHAVTIAMQRGFI